MRFVSGACQFSGRSPARLPLNRDVRQRKELVRLDLGKPHSQLLQIAINSLPLGEADLVRGPSPLDLRQKADPAGRELAILACARVARDLAPPRRRLRDGTILGFRAVGAAHLPLTLHPPFEDSIILTVPPSSSVSGIDSQNRRGVRRGRIKAVAS